MSEKLLTEDRIQKIWSGIFKEIPGGWVAKMIDHTVLCELQDHIAAQEELIKELENRLDWLEGWFRSPEKIDLVFTGQQVADMIESGEMQEE
jgi:hypothetical protein